MIAPGYDTSAIASWGSQWYEDRKTELQTKHEVWDQCMKAVAFKFGDSWAEVEAYRSQRYLSFPWQAVETVSSSYLNGAIPDNDWFEALGRTPDDDTKAKMAQSLLKWQHFKTDFRQDVAMGIRMGCIVGNVPWCVDWTEEVVSLPDEEGYAAQLAHIQMMRQMGVTPPDGAIPKAFPYKDVTSYDGPKLKLGNPFDYVQDLRPSDPKFAARGIRFFKSKAYLNEHSQPDPNGYALYENIEAIQDEPTDKDPTDSTQKATLQEKGINPLPKDMVELIQLEGDLEIPNMGVFRNHILVIANRRTVIRFEPNPFYYGAPSWNLFTLFPDPFSPFGYGLIEPVLGINDGIQCRFNQVVDANTIAINPTFKYKKNGTFDPDTFETLPGGLVPCDDPTNDLQPLVVPDKGSLGLNEVNYLVGLFNQITGASEVFGGGIGGDAASATQASLQAQMGAERRRETLNRINSWLMEILRRQASLNMQLMDKPQWIRVTGVPAPPSLDGSMEAADPTTGIPYEMAPQQLEVRPEDIIGEYDIYTVGANQVSQNRQKAQDLFQLTTAILQSPLAEFIKGDKAVQEFYKMGGFADAWKFVKSEREVKIERQQQQAREAMLQQVSAMARQTPGGEGGGQGRAGQTGPEPGPRALASLPGVSEGPGPTPGGPDESQMAGNRLG